MKGSPTLWHVAIEIPAKTRSNAAVASKSVNRPGERDYLDKSKNNTLFNTALLHVCPGRVYRDDDNAPCLCAWWISL